MATFRKILADFADKIEMPRLGFFIRLSSVGLAFWSADKGYSQGVGTSFVIPNVSEEIMMETGHSATLNSELIKLIQEKLSDASLTEYERSIFMKQFIALKREEENEIPN